MAKKTKIDTRQAIELLAQDLPPDDRDAFLAEADSVLAALKELKEADSSMASLREERDEIVSRHIPDFDEMMERFTESLDRAKRTVQGTLIRFFPTGGVTLPGAGFTAGIKRATPKISVLEEALTIPSNSAILDSLKSLTIGGRPLVRSTLDVTVLDELFRQGYLTDDDKQMLIDAGIIVETTPTPAWNFRKA